MDKYLNLNELIILKASVTSVYVVNDGVKFKTMVETKEHGNSPYIAATFNTEQEALEYKDKIFAMLMPVKGPSISHSMLTSLKKIEEDEFDVSTAILMMKKGYKVRRKTWSEGSYIFLIGNQILDETNATLASALVRNIHEDNWEIYKEEKDND